MSECLEKINQTGGKACHNGKHKSLQVFAKEDGKVDGWCFACDTYVEHPYGDEREAKDIPKPKKKTQEEIQEELDEILGWQTLSIRSRKLRADALEDYGVKVGVSEQDGVTPTLVAFPYYSKGVITGYKMKTLGKNKKQWTVGSMKEVDLFGWDLAIQMGAKRLIITEGEEDAIALRQIINRHTKEQWNDFKPAVVSLQFGVGSVKKNLPKLIGKIKKHFKEIVLCFDNDEPGEEATNNAMKILPNAKVATLPMKDANECLIKGVGKATFNAIQFKISEKKNTRIIWADSLFEAAAEPTPMGVLSWPWPSLNDITRNIRYGETYYIGAGPKIGKSEIVNALAAHFVKEHNIKVMLAKPEEANKKSVKMIAAKLVGKVFHDPKVEFNHKAFKQACGMMKDKVALINLYQHLGWESLKDDIVEAVNDGVKAVFIDPITNLTNGINAADANVKLQAIAQELAAMALDLDIVIFIFCPLKSNEGNISVEVRQKKYNLGQYMGLGNCPHGLGGDVSSDQFAGSRGMMRSCNYMFALEGNKDPNIDDPLIRNRRQLKLLEDREFGESVIIPLYWNKETTMFTEI